jgi:hypothetical protein
MHIPSNNLYFDGLEYLVRKCELRKNMLKEKEKATLEEKWNGYKFFEWVTFDKKLDWTKS